MNIYRVNQRIQTFWLFLYGVLILALPVGSAYLILLCAIPLGLSQILFSFWEVLTRGWKAKTSKHLIYSVIYLIVFFLAATISDYGGPLSEFMWMLVIPPIVLAIHFFYLTFTDLNPKKMVEHHVLDL
ncbi:MAG: hypothetical protein JJ975_16280 [Bacteroidia bacterium]|nr:hypothetical protein [Bacteroidia bacterium]